MLRQDEHGFICPEMASEMASLAGLDCRPFWLECGYIITDPILKTEVDQAEALAEVALLEAKVAPPTDKVRADLAALAQFEMAKAARSAVPEDKEAYGAISCGAAIGDDAFISDFLDNAQRSLCGDFTFFLATAHQAGRYFFAG